VAPLLAHRLRCPSLDLDLTIEQGAGRSVAALFEEGEALFRELESRALEEALGRAGSLVLACGGGILERKENRELLVARARIDPERAASRLTGPGAKTRPLLQGTVPVAERLRALLRERRAGYAAAADTIVDTSQLTPEEVADRIAERLAVA